MKNTMKLNLLFFLVVALSFAFTGCANNDSHETEQITDLLVVMRDKVDFELDGIDECKIVMDVPIDGPKYFVDSVMHYLNHQLHEVCEEVFSRHAPLEEVYSDVPYSLLEHYKATYKPYFDKENFWGMEYWAMLLIAQTDAYVTYGLENYHCGGSCGSEFYCCSFSKYDGHRIDEIISTKSLARCLKKHPEIDHPFNQFQYEHGRFNDSNCIGVGLVEDGLICVNEDYADHYAFRVIDYDEILPYLTKEVQKLVKQGRNSNCKWEDWHIGQRKGTVVTTDGETIILTERPCYEAFEDSDLIDLESEWMWGNDYEGRDLSAYAVEDGKLVPANVIDGKSMTKSHCDDLISSNPEEAVFAFDVASSNLYVPYSENVMMGKHDCFDRYAVYHFDGQKFDFQGDDGGFWLHPSLRQFGRLLYAVKTKDYLIRIDEMRIYDDRYDDQYEAARVDTCRYRYAAWNNKGDADDPDYNMLDNPDIVIYNGYLGEGGFVFLNNGYKYVIQLGEEDGSDESWLLVYHGDKLIYKKCLRNWNFKSVLSFDWDCD